MRLLVSAALLAAMLAVPAAQRSEPFVPIGVWYERNAAPALATLRDLQAIRALGFNHIRSSVEWAVAEPARGTYRFDVLDQLLTFAGESGLKVIVQPTMDRTPWLDRQTADPSAVASFIDAVSSHAERHRAFHAIEPQPNPLRISIYPRSASAPPLSPAELAWRFDEVRSAAGEKGWGIRELQAGPPSNDAKARDQVTGADLRLWGWCAIARGARLITYASWSSASAPPGASGPGLVESNGTITERARAAGQFAGVVSRNAALFAPLRPRPSRVAIVHDAARHGVGSAEGAAAMRTYATLFERNIQADVIRPEAVPGELDKYAVILVPTKDRLNPAELDRIQPEIRVDAAAGVEARVLESADALVLIGINHAEAPRTATFTFPPDTPEAIWQNMETGASVSFVQGPGGVTYKHAFAARDVVVLMIRKRLR